jgi:hypothetical protein
VDVAVALAAPARVKVINKIALRNQVPLRSERFRVINCLRRFCELPEIEFLVVE